MGSEHTAGSQNKLHELFNGFDAFVADQITSLLQRKFGGADSVRILDIGCGGVPYRDGFSEVRDRLTLHLCDKLEVDMRQPCEELMFKRFELDFFDLWPSFTSDRQEDDSEVVDRILGNERYDIVLSVASLHELHYDAVAVYGKPINFHRKFFRFVQEHLLSKSGFLVVADYAWPKPAKTSHVWKIKDAQWEAVKHADPPWAFCSVSGIQREANHGGMQLISSTGRGLHDGIPTQKLRDLYKNLNDAQLETIRSRFGYFSVFRATGSAPDAQEHVCSARPQCASKYLSIRAEETFRDQSNELEGALQTLFVEPIDSKSEKGWKGSAPICHLVHGMRRVIEREHPTFSVFVGVIEVWVNIGLKGHEGTEPTRFVPKLPIQWTDSKVWATAGVISSEALKSDHNSNGNPWSGRIAIPYKNLADTEARTIHSWLADLHGRMRGTATPCTAGRDNYGIRSITVLVQDKTVKNSECTSTGIFYAREWGDDKVQAESGHYLALVPRSVGGIEQSIVVSINSMLRRIENNILGTNEMEVLDDSYENFINEVFYPSATCDKSAEEQYIMWWESNAFSSDSDPPPCRAYSTIAIGCDGLSHDDPDTLMVFSSIAIPPRVLQASCEHLVSLCNRLSKLESEVLIENQATARAQLAERDQQHRAMVSSFGHDGKRPAATIEMLLENPSEFAPKLAMLLSRSLVLRLESFSALLGTPASKDQAHQQLQQEWTDAEDSTTLRQIFEEQAFSVLLQILIGESNWKDIRDNIFGKDRSLDDFGEQLSPILRFLSDVMKAKRGGSALGQDGQNSQERHSAIQATLDLFKKNSHWPGFNLGYEGPDLKLPYYIPGKDGAKTVPLAATAFSFLISEILTNSAKHQWRKLSRQLSLGGLSVMMSVVKSQGQYDISVLSRPVLPTGPELTIDGSVTGLTSMSMVGDRLGITLSSRQIHVGREQRERRLPYPVNEPLELSDDKSPWSTIHLRGFPERADQ